MIALVAASLERLGVADAKLGVAVSGGADSVFLLHALRQVHQGTLVVLHVNHGLRGAASDADESFVQSLATPEQFCSARSFPVTGNLEQHCRRERLRLFGEWIRAGVVHHVATGHTASDQAETVLLRLLRGTGPTGLRGILPRTREGLVRPLLKLDRDVIRLYLRDHGLPWREDSSNADPRFLRNRVRASLLPLLRELEPSIEANLGRLAAIAASEEEYWTTQMPAATSVLDVNSLRAAHPALRRRLLRHAIASSKGNLLRIEKAHLDAVESLLLQLEGDGGVSLPGLEVTRSMGWIRLANPAAPEYRYTEDVVLDLDGGQLQGPLCVRVWQPGDCFQPEGRVEPTSLKKLFQIARVPLWERKNWPIITDGVSIVWMHRFGVDPKFAATGDTRNILRFKAQISLVGESNSSSSTSCI